MHQIKIFKGIESETEVVEKQVNEWLAKEKVSVIQISGNVAPQALAPEALNNMLSRTAHPPSDVLLVVLYEKRD